MTTQQLKGHFMKEEIGSHFFNLDCYDGIECVRANFKNQHFSKHIHEGYAIGVIEHGAQSFFNQGENHTSGAGSLVIVNADTAHTGSPASENGWGYRAMYPTPELFDDLLSDLTFKSKNAPYFHRPIIDDEKLIKLFNLIFRSLADKPSRLTIETTVYNFFVQLTLNSKTNSSVIPSKKANKSLLIAKEYIHAYASQEISLENLSRLVGMSKYHLIRQFQASFGITPHQYQIQSRLQKAKSLLKNGEQPSNVASECGFFDQSHMNSHFKKALGTTPYHYQKRINA
ncbi:AraC family transcriptional regulator [Marinomonas sp. A3A]|uniref:AraC family transcriptional regulator n=1 Tax=Marinomonas sp. A3A TaxID=2065312 RepID=UPI001BB3AD48|nr:AraC family transcriptional regulator [Marinomonas sp. A3A]